MIEDVQYLVQNCLQFAFVKSSKVTWNIGQLTINHITNIFIWLNFIMAIDIDFFKHTDLLLL